MDILNILIKLRDDIKTWVTTNLNALNAKIDEKTIPIDGELDSSSTNPVQNKVVANAINNIPRFSGDYNDLSNAPNITEDESGSMVIADESGNIIFKADTDGIHTTAVSINGEAAASQKYVDEAIANADVDLTGYATEDFVTTAIDSAKEELSETIIAESEDWKIVDNNGNIIFSIDNAGAHTTDLTLNGEKAAAETYVNEAIANIDFPETDLSDYYTKEQTDEAIKTAKEEISESITSESNEWKVVDNAGNIIFSVDANGTHTTNLTLNSKEAATKEYVDNVFNSIEIPETDFTGYATEKYVDNKVADLVNSAPEALDTLGEFAAALENHEDAYDALLETVGNKATHTDLENLKEELSESIVAEAEDWKVVDNNGNIIFSVDNTGAHTTSLTLNGEEVATKTYVDEAIDNIEFPETDLTGYATEKYVDDAIEAIEFPETDLSNYYTKEETETAINTAKEELSESIVSESNEWKVVDETGNIIFSVDKEGAHTTDITLDGMSVKEFIDNITTDLGDMGGGDMMKAIYDADDDGIVDEARNLFINDISWGHPTPLDGLIEPGVYYLERYDGYDCCLVEVMQPQENQILQRVYFGPLHGKSIDKAEDLSTIRYRVGSIVEDTVTWDSWGDYSAGYAKQAFADSNGKDIVDTYATKNSLEIIQSQVDNHFKNTEIHTTSEEKQIWNAKSDFSGNYNDLENAPNINEDGSGNLIIADEQGNIILQSNGDGLEIVNLIVQNITINGKTIQEMIQDYVNEAILGGAW